MGEAERRGTRDQRIAAAVEEIRARDAEAKRLAAERDAHIEQARAARWNALSAEQKERRIAIAGQEVAILSSAMDTPLGRLLVRLGPVIRCASPDTGMADNGEVRP